MRRQELSSSIGTIISDIEESGVQSALEGVMNYLHMKHSSPERSTVQVPLEVFQKYMIATHEYDSNKLEIFSILGLSKILTSKFWQELTLIDETENYEDLVNIIRSLTFTMTHLPKILELTKQHFITEVKEKNPDLPDELKGKTLLTVLMTEDEGQFSKPKRLVNTLGAISDFYDVVATIENESKNELIVLACDSGSDKSFDFLGLAKVMVQVKEIICSIWDRKVFHRHDQAGETLNLITDSLPILVQIAELEKTNVIVKEQAELLKRQIISGATQFIESGAIIPEFEAISSHSPKQLMRPEQKLLSSPSSNSLVEEKPSDVEISFEENSDTNSEGLSEDEANMLALLVKKSKVSDQKNADEKLEEDKPKVKRSRKPAQKK